METNQPNPVTAQPAAANNTVAERPEDKQDNTSIYHRPGMTIQAKDGAEYLVGKSGAWTKTQEKKTWNRLQKEKRRAAKTQAASSDTSTQDTRQSS
jgi:hypothetical protein